VVILNLWNHQPDGFRGWIHLFRKPSGWWFQREEKLIVNGAIVPNKVVMEEK